MTAARQPLRLGFVAGGRHWLVEAGGVQVIDAAITPLPLAQPWYLGLARLRQQLLGVIDLPGLLGGPVSPPRPTERLLVLPPPWRTALRVDRVLGLMDAAALADDQAGGLDWQALDIAGLCNSPTFLNAGWSLSR